jgi:hypothetical protein
MAKDTSPGKYLKMTAELGSSGPFHPLVPRRGDIILRKEAWSDAFLHEQNFWHSAIKWHRGREIALNKGNLFICLSVDKDPMPTFCYNVNPNTEPRDLFGCILHRECKDFHPSPSSGFAELYQNADMLRWRYLGRTKLLFDIVPEIKDNPYIIFYMADDGENSDNDLEEPLAQSPWLIK